MELREYRPYRSYKQLLECPNDMNEREKERYEQIMKIPEELRDVLAQDAEDLRKEIVALERRRDRILDYLNGESISIWSKEDEAVS